MIQKIKELIKIIFAKLGKFAFSYNNDLEDDGPSIRHIYQFGLSIVLIFVIGFLFWATFAPLESAAIAQGKIVVVGNKKSIQHLEGGIVKKIFIKDGDPVKKGQTLIKLSNVEVEAAYVANLNQIYELMATESRLKSHRDNKKEIVFTTRLQKHTPDNKYLRQLLIDQRNMFKSLNLAHKKQIVALYLQLDQMREEIRGLQEQIKSNLKQDTLIKEEIKTVTFLAEKRLVEKSRLLALVRHEASLEGIRSDMKARINILLQKIAENAHKITVIEENKKSSILLELRQVQQKLNETTKRETILLDELSRLTIKSPQNGKVVGLNIHTIGGVIRPGEILMEVVPDEKLIIEARINPLDIDIVHRGLQAKIKLTPLKTRHTSYMEGVVTNVSADAFHNPQTKGSYYLARIQILDKSMDFLDTTRILYPGMPVQVMIITNKATLLNYLLSPLMDSFERAFREE